MPRETPVFTHNPTTNHSGTATNRSVLPEAGNTVNYLARNPNKRKNKLEKTGNLQTAQLTSFLLHPARPGLLLSHSSVLKPTTVRGRDRKTDKRERLVINSHDTPPVYRCVVRTSPRKYVTAADKVETLERHLLAALQRCDTPTCCSQAA